MPYERDEVLARTELAELCDEFLGPRKGRGPSATWPCPSTGHGPQTGRTPPVGVFRTHYGEQRWRCHGCGAGGSALDLVMQAQGLDFAGAVAVLGRRSGAAERPGQRPDRPFRTGDRARPPAPVPTPSPVIEDYVAACEAFLWSPAGRPQHAWLAGRGLGDDVLVANRVGADPGPRRMARPAGLPRGGMGVVLPVLDGTGRATYLQTRYLGHPRRRYENPATALVGVSPRLAEVRVAGPCVAPDAVVVCEGILDALSAAQAGQRAVAVLGVAAPNRAMADQVVQRFPGERLVVAFDGDPAGRCGAERMVELLADAGAGERVGVVEVPGDLNDWLRASGERFPAELGAAVAAGGAGSAGRSTPAIEDAVETIWYRHVLVDDPALARSNGERIEAALEAFGAGRPPPPTTAATAGLDADLGDFAYRFALGDDRAAVAADLDHARRAVRAWTAELAHQPFVLSAEPEIPAMALARAAAAAMEPAGLSLGVGR